MLVEDEVEAVATAGGQQVRAELVEVFLWRVRLQCRKKIVLGGAGGRERELWVLSVEIYDFGEGVHFGGFELADELCEAFFELGVDDGLEGVATVVV